MSRSLKKGFFVDPKLMDKHLLDKVCTANKSPSFPNTKEMRIILDFFKKQDWISSYNEKNNTLRANIQPANVSPNCWTKAASKRWTCS